MTSMLVLGLISLQVTWGLAANPIPNTTLPPTPLSDASAPIQEIPRSVSSTRNQASDPSALGRIKITAGNGVMYATMNGTSTAREFFAMLPLTLKAFDRIGLVKSTVLPHSISDDAERTRKYAIGSIFYWPEGPEVAFCYSNHLPETVVEIIPIGMLESGVEYFRSYTGEILIEQSGNTPVQVEPPKQLPSPAENVDRGQEGHP